MYNWDGSVGKILNSRSRQGTISDNARTQSGWLGIAYLDLCSVFQGDHSLLRFVRDRMPGNVSVEQIGKHAVLTARSDGLPPRRGNPFDVSIWLAPGKGFMPEVIDIFRGTGDEKVHHATRVNTLSEVSPGFWLPVKSRIAVYVTERASKFYGQESGYILVDVDLARSRFNCELDDSVLEVRFPFGTTVLDDVKHVTYVIGGNNTVDHLEKLATLGKETIEDVRRYAQNHDLESTQAGRPLFRYILVLAPLLVMGVLLAIRLRRRS